MKVITQSIPYDKPDDVFTLYYLTDWHIGAKAFDERQFKADVAEIATDPLAIWIGGGDFIDAICQVGDKRYRPSTMAVWTHGQDDIMGAELDYAKNLIVPIAEKCAGLVKGNHEDAALKWYGRDVYWYFVECVARLSGVDPGDLALGYQGFVRFSFNRPGTKHRTAIDVYCHHGYNGGRLPGGDALALDRVLGQYQCDLALMGHRHKFMTLPKQVVGIGHNRNFMQSIRWGAFVGSYLKAYIQPSTDNKPVDTYAETTGLPPQPTGTTRIRIQPETRKMQIVSGDAL